MNYIKRLHHAQALLFSVGTSYYEYQLMHTLFDNFHQGGKYTAQIANHQEELKIEENITDQKLYIFHLYRLIT